MKTLFAYYECAEMKGNAVLGGFDDDFQIKGQEEIDFIKSSIIKILGIQGVPLDTVAISFIKWLPYG